MVNPGVRKENGHKNKLLGLIGFPLKHSFSRAYFAEKFTRQGIVDYSYENFELDRIEMLPDLLRLHPELVGLNVTIPYKQSVIPYLDWLDPTAKNIGAVNTIKIRFKEGKTTLEGYNTDALGFSRSLENWLGGCRPSALVLGSGGASMAIRFVLDSLKINYKLVSRKPIPDCLVYEDLDVNIIRANKLLINCTPLGTFPGIDGFPPIPYDGINGDHLLYDLVYNPEITVFLQQGKNRGARIKNGLEMLLYQADAAWEIWSS